MIKLISSIIIFGGLILMIISSYNSFMLEKETAKQFCEEMGKEYKIKLLYKHYCDGDRIYNYKNSKTGETFWDFERDFLDSSKINKFKINLSAYENLKGGNK